MPVSNLLQPGGWKRALTALQSDMIAVGNKSPPRKRGSQVQHQQQQPAAAGEDDNYETKQLHPLQCWYEYLFVKFPYIFFMLEQCMPFYAKHPLLCATSTQNIITNTQLNEAMEYALEQVTPTACCNLLLSNPLFPLAFLTKELRRCNKHPHPIDPRKPGLLCYCWSLHATPDENQTRIMSNPITKQKHNKNACVKYFELQNQIDHWQQFTKIYPNECKLRKTVCNNPAHWVYPPRELWSIDRRGAFQYQLTTRMPRTWFSYIRSIVFDLVKEPICTLLIEGHKIADQMVAVMANVDTPTERDELYLHFNTIMTAYKRSDLTVWSGYFQNKLLEAMRTADDNNPPYRKYPYAFIKETPMYIELETSICVYLQDWSTWNREHNNKLLLLSIQSKIAHGRKQHFQTINNNEQPRPVKKSRTTGNFATIRFPCIAVADLSTVPNLSAAAPKTVEDVFEQLEQLRFMEMGLYSMTPAVQNIYEEFGNNNNDDDARENTWWFDVAQ